VCLIKQKLKTKKYQYMYLWEKLESRGLRNDYNAEFYDDSSFITDDNRIIFYYSWLEKINKKYNYV